jgi:hypothetical protein
LRSQRAIKRIGLVKECVMRNDMILPDGPIRHSLFIPFFRYGMSGVKTVLEEMTTM